MSPRPLDGHTARKRFGQNFLVDRNVIANIVKVIAAKRGEPLVEIGPGLGALTGPLVEATGFLEVIEIDRDLAPRIAGRFGDQVRVHEADALRFDFAALAAERGQPLRVVGNLPYNISTPLVFHLLESAAHIHDMHFMLQKEVVDRMGAAAGEDDYGRLSVLLQYRCRVEPLFTVPPGAFNPQPKVQSAIVRLVPQAPAVPARDEAMLSRLVTQAFSQRRKTLRNAVRGLLDDDGIAACGIDPGVRCETLTVAQFVALADRAAGGHAVSHAYRIDVEVRSEFLPDQSDESAHRYVFAYHITLRNSGDIAAQLLTRHWIVTDGNQRVQEVHGEGVIGKKPRLAPGESFSYSSGTVLNTPVGAMHGSYQMVAADGTRFDAPIAPFTLAVPRSLH